MGCLSNPATLSTRRVIVVLEQYSQLGCAEVVHGAVYDPVGHVGSGRHGEHTDVEGGEAPAV